MNTLRLDHHLIASMVSEGTRVLDIGCGQGDLLAHLRDAKSVDGRGIELDPTQVNACLSKGLAVIQGDADKDLEGYPTGAFDVAILSQTVQAMHRPRHVLAQLLRVADTVIVSFPNFAYWRVRLSLAISGRMPVTKNLPNKWYNTPNIHLCTVGDFTDLCTELHANVDEAVALLPDGRSRRIHATGKWSNLTAETAIFRISAKDHHTG